MKRDLDEIAGGKIFSGSLAQVPPKLEEAFLEQALAYERAELDTNFNRLLQRGVALPPAADLDEAGLGAKLAEVIRALGEWRCFLQDTNLSDRDLYDWLWKSGLRDESPDVSEMPDAAWHTSPIGAGSAEDTTIWLKYYADEKDRRRWHLSFPDDPQPPPFDRDRDLPKRSIF